MAKKKSKDITEYTEEQLISYKKAIFGLLMVLLAVVLLFAAYYVYLLASGTFDPSRHLLGLVPMLALLPAASLNYMNYARFDKELKRRAGN
ncbi:MAG: hypothetical protein AAF399_06205 [Bacteroidota bacterium]